MKIQEKEGEKGRKKERKGEREGERERERKRDRERERERSKHFILNPVEPAHYNNRMFQMGGLPACSGGSGLCCSLYGDQLLQRS